MADFVFFLKEKQEISMKIWLFSLETRDDYGESSWK